ncbi:MAG: energy-coupling factor transporter transmembrane protein EcfT [Ruminiclostridium sp.]|nr:energy-coupling factor transporter transmembrane protein EcfT [Ruminiclostridium sp.]
MLKDITIGQFFPGHSVIHRMDSRFKIVLEIIYVVMLFAASNFYGLGISAVFIFTAFAVSGISFKMMIKSIKPILPIILFTAVLNILFVKGEGEPLASFWIIEIYYEGIEISAFMIVRIILLIVGMSLLTYTTSPIVLTDAIESLMSPLKKIKFPVHELAMMMTIALRFIPTLIEETDKIMMAQKARGANLDSGGLLKRAKSLVPILIPLFVSAFKRANELATAMECRCYRGGDGRTRLRTLKATKLDFFMTGITLCVFGFVIVNNIVFG